MRGDASLSGLVWSLKQIVCRLCRPLRGWAEVRDCKEKRRNTKCGRARLADIVTDAVL